MSGNENSPAASDKTDPPSPSVNNGSEVTESGTADFVENWIDGKCVFCKQELKDISEPKLLQCLHTSCKSCLSSESVPSPSTSTTSVQSAKQLTCPACSQEVNTGEVIDHLFLLEHLSKSAEGQVPEESKIYACTSCEEGAVASAFCLDCQEWLCETCVSAHHRVRVTKDHVIRLKDEMEGEKTSGLSQKYLFCPVHSHEQLKLYCETCDKLTCRDCQLSDHKDHKYQFLSKACEDEKQHFSSLLAKIKEKQTHIERACNLVNQRHHEITQREQAVTQEVKTFAVKFITEINRRGKQLLQELNDVCTNKKNQLSFKNQELANMGQRLEHCMKFSESAVAHGSDVALVYSKKLIMSQLRRILRHRCEVPDLQHMVDIQFTYESNFLTNYISQLGCLLVDQRPVGGVLPGQQQNRNNPMMQMAAQNPNNQQGNQVQGRGHTVIPQTPTAINQRAMPVQQQINHNAPQRQQGSLYGQPQVTSSTHPAQNPTNQIRHVNPNNQISYTRNPNQNAMNTVQQQQQQQQNQAQNFRAAANVTYTQRPVQQTPGNTTVRQQVVQQQQQQQQQSQTFQQTPLPVPLVGNSSITISAVAGPTPPKQRAVAPRANMQLIPVNQQADSPSKRLQNTGNQQQQQRNTPQVIVIDDAPSAPKMTMSNTSRLTHFPSGTTGSSGVQIQPVNFNSSGSTSLSGTIIAQGHSNIQLRNLLESSPSSSSSVSSTSLSRNSSVQLPAGSVVVSASPVASAAISTTQLPIRSNLVSQVQLTPVPTVLQTGQVNILKQSPTVTPNIVSVSKPVKVVLSTASGSNVISGTVSTTIRPIIGPVISTVSSLAPLTAVSTNAVITSPSGNIVNRPQLNTVPFSPHTTVRPASITVRAPTGIIRQILPSNSVPGSVSNSLQFNIVRTPSAIATVASNTESSLPQISSTYSMADMSNKNKQDVILKQDKTASKPEKNQKTSDTEEATISSSAKSVDDVPQEADSTLPSLAPESSPVEEEVDEYFPSLDEMLRPSNKAKKKSSAEISTSEKGDEGIDAEETEKTEKGKEKVKEGKVKEPKEVKEKVGKEKEDKNKANCVGNKKKRSKKTAKKGEEEKKDPESMDSDLPKDIDIPHSDPNDDWCSVCHDGGELLCCSHCPRVYHLNCHVPVLSTTPDEDWSCMMCANVKRIPVPEEVSGSKRKMFGIKGREQLLCERILLELFCHEQSLPFHLPVNKKVPEYYKLISQPMDFSTIRQKLSVSYYQRYANVESFLADIRLVFKNCRTYNDLQKGEVPPGTRRRNKKLKRDDSCQNLSDVYKQAIVIEEFFDDLLNMYLPDYAYDTTVGQTIESKDYPDPDVQSRSRRRRYSSDEGSPVHYR